MAHAKYYDNGEGLNLSPFLFKKDCAKMHIAKKYFYFCIVIINKNNDKMRKKINPLFMTLVAAAVLQSCSCSDNRRSEEYQEGYEDAMEQKAQTGYPVAPTNGQVYIDNSGNRSTWDAVMQAWVISSMLNGRSVNHYYYPSSGLYRDYSGRTISRPAHIPAYRTATPSRNFRGNGNSGNNPSRSFTRGNGSSGKSSGSFSRGSSSSSSSSAPARSGGFGSSGKGSSSAS
jgi:hypothetical protein